MKLLITGSRKFNNKEEFDDVMNQVDGDIELIIHGGAQGADILAEKYAEEYNINSKVVRPVNKRIPSHYLHRNAEMVAICDEVIAFWDGESRGTKFTIDYAQARGKPLTIYRTDLKLK